MGENKFKRRQRVNVLHGAGPEAATIVRADREMVGWWIVKFDDGHKLCVHGTGIEAVG